jgi:hypothetical protein
MISWTIPGTVAGLTGVTIVTGSSSHSNTYSASGSQAAQTDTASGSGLTTYSFRSVTSVGLSGRTASVTESSSAGNAGGLTISQSGINSDDEETQTAFTYTNAGSTTFSTSNIATEVLTAQAQTSTTETFESGYEAYYTTSYEAYEGQAPLWTTSVETISGGTETSVVFYQTYATSISAIEFSYLTRAATSDAVTTLGQTITLSAIPNTVVQAETRYPNAEVIYLQTAQIDNVDGYTAATNVAQSGTRFTVSPVIITAAKAPANYTRPTSSIASQQSTSLVNLTSSKSTQATRTIANYFSFPPTTTTQAVGGMTTTQTVYATNFLSLQQAITHGGATDTVTAKEFGAYWRAVTRQIGSRTFQAAVQDATSYSITQTLEAAASSSFSNSFSFSGFKAVNIALGNETVRYDTVRSSGVTANTVLPTARVVIGVGGQAQQLKYGTIGAAINGDVGGWLTANATSVGFVFFGNIAANIYAKDGAHRSATTMFPATNEKQTIVGNSITWTASTAGILSIDGATSKKTTTSAEIGVDGTAQTTTVSRSISNFGGSAGGGETFVQTAHPGVYKNRINGATTVFDGSASVISNGQSQSLAMWQAIRGVVSMVSATNANPVTWAEARNNIGLPPYT